MIWKKREVRVTIITSSDQALTPSSIESDILATTKTPPVFSSRGQSFAGTAEKGVEDQVSPSSTNKKETSARIKTLSKEKVQKRGLVVSIVKSSSSMLKLSIILTSHILHTYQEALASISEEDLTYL